MVITRRQIVTGLSVLWLTALMTLAAYALHSTRVYNLPIPTTLSAFTLGLPPIAGLALEIITGLNKNLASKGQLRSSLSFTITLAILLIYETVVATLAGTHISPVGGLTCALREQWQDMFSSKSDGRVRRIQDTWNCCGFANPRDMAFPFPDKTHGPDACTLAFGRDRGCLEPWRSEERKVAVMLVLVPILVFIWKLLIFTTPQTRPSWLSSALRLPQEEAGASAGSRQRQALEYRDVEEADRDEVSGEVQTLNRESQLATHVEGARVQPSGLLHGDNQWSRERADA